MDEYLSKPLKPTHLIQTILKCATLGGALLERKNDGRGGILEENKKQNSDENGTADHTKLMPPRPGMTDRGYTDNGAFGLESPAILTMEQDDPMTRVSIGLVSLCMPLLTSGICTAGVFPRAQRLKRPSAFAATMKGSPSVRFLIILSGEAHKPCGFSPTRRVKYGVMGAVSFVVSQSTAPALIFRRVFFLLSFSLNGASALAPRIPWGERSIIR